jgi:hypothetical protein
MEKLGRNAPRERGFVSSSFTRPSFETRASALLRMRSEHAERYQTLMVRRRASAVSNHEAKLSPTSSLRTQYCPNA